MGITIYRRRCRGIIAQKEIRAFVDSLKRLQETVDDKQIALKELETLASNVLCHRSHQDQAHLLAKWWLKEMESISVTKDDLC